MLVLSRKSGQSILINDDIEITIVEVANDKVKIGIEAPKNVRILRNELCMTVENNKEAAEKIKPDKINDMFSGFSRN